MDSIEDGWRTVTDINSVPELSAPSSRLCDLNAVDTSDELDDDEEEAG